MDDRHCRQGSLLATVTGVGEGGEVRESGGGGGGDKCVKTMDGDAEFRSCVKVEVDVLGSRP